MTPRTSLHKGVWILLVLLSLVSSWPQAGSTTQVGYARIESVDGGNVPVTSALFSLRSGGILVSEAGIAAVEPIASGRIFVDQSGNSTGLAMANPSNQAILVQMTLRNDQGNVIGQKNVNLAAGGHFAKFVNDLELFPESPSNLLGSLTFQVLTAGVKVAAVTIRQGLSARMDPLFATLPVASLEENTMPTGGEPSELVLPQIGAGFIGATTTSLSTQVLLFNLTDSTVGGQIRLFQGDGSPLVANLEGTSGSTFEYVIPPNGVLRRTLASTGPTVQGYALISQTQGPRLPAATAVFRFQTPDGPLSEAGVDAIPPTTRARIFVDNVGTQIGVALARPGVGAGKVTFELLDRNGFSIASTTRDIAAGGHLPIFVDQLFPAELNASFTGILEIRADDPFVPITLKLTPNSRGDPILTTLPVADLMRPPGNQTRILPQIAFAPTLSTRLIILWPDKSQVGQFRLVFRNSDASPMLLPVTGNTASQFDFVLNRGGARQVRPNNLATPSQLLLNFGMASQGEIPVSTGSSSVVRTLVVDSEGDFRDDFDPTFSSLDTSVASVDRFGEVKGLSSGFSTLSVQLGALVRLSTIQVSDFSSGQVGFSIEGVAEDASGQLFITSPTTHRVLTLGDLNDFPQLYAGVELVPGFKDDQREDALFDMPTFLTLDAANNRLYVADSSNRRIRLVEAGPAGQVTTLAGTGQSGNQDGVASNTTFTDPRGVALDNQGGLWIVDRGNHTIRRLDLASGQVSTIAGSPGVSGFQDGTGGEALFSSPTGIAFEAESIAQQLERQQTNAPPPPVRMIVADTGNGALRRVELGGNVETVAVDEPAPSGMSPSPFVDPTGVGVDAFGTIFVSEPSLARVSALLPSGELEQIHQANVLVQPRGISITQGGRLVIADGDNTLREILFGGPQIDSLSPPALKPAGNQEVMVEGKNFAAETLVLVGGRAARTVEVLDSMHLRIVTPALGNQSRTLLVQTRGGTDQIPFDLDQPTMDELPPGAIVTVAGGGGFAGDGGPAQDALTNRPLGVAFDSQGNLYVSEGVHNRVRRINAQTGIVQTVAGQGPSVPFLDDLPGPQATLNFPLGLALTPSGDLLIADSQNHRIRRLSAQTGVLQTIAGTGMPGYSGDQGPALQAQLNSPYGVAADSSGTIYIADTGNSVIRRIEPEKHIIETLAGSDRFQIAGTLPDILTSPFKVTVDLQGRPLIADTGKHRVLRISDEQLVVVAGTGEPGYSGDGGPPQQASLRLPSAVAVDRDGNIYIDDYGNNRIRVIDFESGLISTFAGAGCCHLEDGIDARDAFLFAPIDISVDGAGNVVIADFQNNLIRKVDPRTGLIDSVLGRGSNGDGGPASGARMFLPTDVDYRDANGSLMIADRGGFQVREVDQKGTVRTIAGNGRSYSIDEKGGIGIGDGSLATAAAVGPAGIVRDDEGYLLIADFASNRVRIVEMDTGNIFTLFSSYSSGDFSFPLSVPLSLDYDTFGNLFVSNTGTDQIVFLAAQGFTGVFVNRDAVKGFSGDGGFSADARLNLSTGGGVANDRAPGQTRSERLFIADTGNNRVRFVQGTTINTFAGNGSDQASGDGGPATKAGVPLPISLAFDQQRNILYIATFDNRIRSVDSRGIIHTIAGTGQLGYSGDGADATRATFRYPSGMAVDSEGNLYIADQYNYAVRMIRLP